jgi:hypothetical protein
MLLGQVVAISVASALFFMVMLSVPISGTVSPTKISTLLVTSVLGIITVLISPFVATGEYFMLNLLVMHALLIFPLFNAKSPSNNPASVPIRSVAYIAILYSLAAGTNISIYIDRWLICLSNMSDMKEAISTLFSIVFQHPAQSSISFDIMCINLISIVWMINDGYRKKGRLSYQSLLSALSTPLFSASATLPFYFAISEIQNLASGSLKKD